MEHWLQTQPHCGSTISYIHFPFRLRKSRQALVQKPKDETVYEQHGIQEDNKKYFQSLSPRNDSAQKQRNKKKAARFRGQSTSRNVNDISNWGVV